MQLGSSMGMFTNLRPCLVSLWKESRSPGLSPRMCAAISVKAIDHWKKVTLFRVTRLLVLKVTN